VKTWILGASGKVNVPHRVSAPPTQVGKCRAAAGAQNYENLCNNKKMRRSHFLGEYCKLTPP